MSMAEEVNTIYGKLADVQHKLKVGKDAWNSFSNYKYRNAETILTAVKPLLQEQGLALLMSEEMKLVGDRYYIVSTAHLSEGQDFIEVSAWAREEAVKKGMDASQITGSATSYARKYALGGLFAIDDGNDADAQDNTQATSKPATKTTAPKPTKDAPAKQTAVRVPYTLLEQTKINDLAKDLGYSDIVIRGKLATLQSKEDVKKMIARLEELQNEGV